MTEPQVWRYAVDEANTKWRARQFLNGILLKCTWVDTEEGAQQLCKTWAAKSRPGRKVGDVEAQNAP